MARDGCWSTRVTAAALVALAVAGCGGETRRSAAPEPSRAAPASSPSAAPSASTSTPTADGAGPTASAATVVPADEPAYVVSPTGNIACQLTATAATCDIRERSYPDPPRPADCELDHGQMITVGARGEATFLCHGDTAYDPAAPALAYGERITNGVFTCHSSRSGMSCATAAGDHGFELSRAGYRLF